MSYPKLPPWPFIDPDDPPKDYIKVGESIDWDRSKTAESRWHFFVANHHLLIARKTKLEPRNGETNRYAVAQYEYPIAGARWFVDTIERFQLPPDHPNATPRGKFNVRGEVEGETLGVTRGAGFGCIGPNGFQIPGYSFDNLNRIEHNTIQPNGHRCQMFEMGDPWLFEHGLLDLFKEIAERHERGEF